MAANPQLSIRFSPDFTERLKRLAWIDERHFTELARMFLQEKIESAEMEKKLPDISIDNLWNKGKPTGKPNYASYAPVELNDLPARRR